MLPGFLERIEEGSEALPVYGDWGDVVGQAGGVVVALACHSLLHGVVGLRLSNS